MGLTSAMYTGLTGLSANQTRIETIGHNIANVNTTAFKGSRTLFQTQFSEIRTPGTPPSDTSGGTNPIQIGRGVLVGTTQRSTLGGTVETTGLASDLAVEGNGYFLVRSAAGQTYYTRDGAFSLDSNAQFVTADGHHVLGYGVDAGGAIVPGTLQPITIPLGQLSITRATERAALTGDLSAGESVATQGSVHTTQALVSGSGAAADAATLLSDLRSASAPGTVLLADGDVLTVSGATRGDRSVAPQQFVVGTTGSTLGDFATWLERVFGIQADAGLAGSPGVTVENGALVIRSNTGGPNAIDISANDLLSTNAGVALPFAFTQTQEATGGGVYTSFTVYDSLGNPATVTARFALESASATGPVWRYYLESADGRIDRSMATGTVSFDVNGNYMGSTNSRFALDRSGSGAASPLTFDIDFGHLNGLSTQTSNVILRDQDGYPPGVLSNYAVQNDGRVTGVFSNGLSRALAQIPLATFANEQGLIAEADNVFSIGHNSGAPAITTAGTLGAGLIRGGALEMSNVDVSREFIGLITASTGFQAASRVISVSNEMLDQLLLTLR